MSQNDQSICKLLLAIAGGTDAQTSRHDIIFKGAAAAISRLTAENDTFRRLLSECAEVLDDEGYEGAARRVREAIATAPLTDAQSRGEQ